MWKRRSSECNGKLPKVKDVVKNQTWPWTKEDCKHMMQECPKKPWWSCATGACKECCLTKKWQRWIREATNNVEAARHDQSLVNPSRHSEKNCSATEGKQKRHGHEYGKHQRKWPEQWTRWWDSIRICRFNTPKTCKQRKGRLVIMEGIQLAIFEAPLAARYRDFRHMMPKNGRRTQRAASRRCVEPASRVDISSNEEENKRFMRARRFFWRSTTTTWQE